MELTHYPLNQKLYEFDVGRTRSPVQCGCARISGIVQVCAMIEKKDHYILMAAHAGP